MEYGFEINGKNHRIELDAYSLTYKVDGEAFNIRYAQISKVRLSRPKIVDNKKLFESTIYIIDGPNLQLQSFSKNVTGTEDHFNHYTQFIRVLHMHLISKSNASFRYGMSYSTILAYAVIGMVALAFAFILSLKMDSTTTLLYFVAPVVVGPFVYKILSDRPGSYRPDIIPYHILPGN